MTSEGMYKSQETQEGTLQRHSLQWADQPSDSDSSSYASCATCATSEIISWKYFCSHSNPGRSGCEKYSYSGFKPNIWIGWVMSYECQSKLKLNCGFCTFYSSFHHRQNFPLVLRIGSEVLQTRFGVKQDVGLDAFSPPLRIALFSTVWELQSGPGSGG